MYHLFIVDSETNTYDEYIQGYFGVPVTLKIIFWPNEKSKDREIENPNRNLPYVW